ncbi:hypothetical protein B0H13DRAFT_2281963 [Mycena leptocephala]|nr:hypothetical protein B0H13DRAFT_2281963 [Mycena leptocephala]
MDTASEPTLRRSNRDTTRVARNDATLQVAQFAGFVTPSPPDAGGRRRHEDIDFSPNGPTPAAARVFTYNNGADTLNLAEQKAVEKLMQKYGPDDRCLITQEKVKLLTERWGCKKLFDVNTPEDVVKLGPEFHYMIDHKQLGIIPERKVVRMIAQEYRRLYDMDPLQKPKPFAEMFPTPPEGWTFVVLPLDIDPERKIFRHKIAKNKDGRTYDSTGEYEPHKYPYPNLRMQTHANPLYAIWHVAVELDKLHPTRRAEIKKKVAVEAPETAESIEDILALYDMWIPGQDSDESIVDGTAPLIPHNSENKNIDDQSPVFDNLAAGDVQDVFLHRAAASEPAFPPDADDFHSIPDTGSDAESGPSSPSRNGRMLHDARSAPARHHHVVPPTTTSESSNKRKQISPLADGGLAAADSPPQFPLMQRRRIQDDITVPIAFPRPESPTFRLWSQSEGGSRATKGSKGTIAQKLTWVNPTPTSRGDLGGPSRPPGPPQSRSESGKQSSGPGAQTHATGTTDPSASTSAFGASGDLTHAAAPFRFSSSRNPANLPSAYRRAGPSNSGTMSHMSQNIGRINLDGLVGPNNPQNRASTSRLPSSSARGNSPSSSVSTRHQELLDRAKRKHLDGSTAPSPDLPPEKNVWK